MKRIVLFALALTLLLGCAVPTGNVEPAPTAAVVELTVGKPATAAPASTDASAPDATDMPDTTNEPDEPDVPLGSLVPESAYPALAVSDGAQYGCDVVCFADGFGYGYDLDGGRAKDCRLYVEAQPTEDLPPIETHRLLLAVGGETYCLGELRFDTGHLGEQNVYGLSYVWVVTDSDLVDLEPVSIALPDAPQERIAFLCGWDAAAGTADVLTAEKLPAGPDEPTEFDPDSLTETPVTLTVPETAVLTVISDEGAQMALTRDRFFALLDAGYIGFLPAEDEDLFVGCDVGLSGNTLLWLCELGAE